MSRRLLCILLTAAFAGTALAATAATPAHAAKGMEVAVQDDPSFVSEISLKRKKALQLAQKLHVTRIRVNIPWVAVVNNARSKKKPKHPKYDFTSYDRLWLAAHKRGIRLQLTITGAAPAWATGPHQVGNVLVDVGKFKGYVHAVINHFHGKVDRFAIWNEPNWRSWNSPLKGNAERYRNMYVAAYKIIKARDKNAKVLIGETSPYGESGRSTAPVKFLREVVKKGPLKADGYAHHPYDYVHNPDWPSKHDDNASISGLRNLTDELDKLARQKKLTTPKGKPLNLFLTEYGFMASGKYKKSDDKRAKYLPRAFTIALKNPRVRMMTQYFLAPPPPWSDFFDMSIVKSNGKPTKPFWALADWAKKQAKARMIALPFPH